MRIPGRPDDTALIWRHRRISYRELGAATAAVAGRMAESGVSQGDLVPVVLPRGVELVSTLLGIAATGAGYAALDPAWPDARIDELRSMLGSAKADACCVFFTSGSTGKPKAVPATRRALTRLLLPGGMPLRLDASTVMTAAAPTPWDAFALELWGPLLNCGTCVLTADLTPNRLREHVSEDGVNTVWLTSSLFSLFVEEDVGAFTGITQVATGGERLSPEHVREFLRAHPRIRLVNGYGPVENCIFSTAHVVRVEDCDRPDGIPIGRPVRGTTVHVLDGELCRAGDRLASGYLGVPEGFGIVEIDGVPTRVYRTGDLGRRDEHGVFHFLGRLDRQVKVRGHRVEPAEVERHVLAHPDVRQCAVFAEGSDLVACYQATRPVPGLPEFLRARLPAHLVPDRWLPVDRMPLSSNGKTDLAALRTMAAVGTHLPVNSLELIRLCIRVARRLDVDIDPVRLLAEPTMARLTDLVRTATPAARAPETSVHSLTDAQLAVLNSADQDAWHCTLLWWIDGVVDEVALRRAVERVHQRHPALHAGYVAKPVPMALTWPPTEPSFAVVATEQAVLDALAAPFTLGRGPVWRAVLARVGDRVLFGVAVHHVAFDGWSERVLAEDLAKAYVAESWSDEPLPWPAFVPVPRSAEWLAGTPAVRLPPGTAGDDRTERVVHAIPATSFVVGLAAYAAAMRAVTGATDFPLAVPVSRRGPATADSVGCLLSLVVLRLRHGAPISAALRLAMSTQDTSLAEAVGMLAPPVMPNLFVVQEDAVALDLPGCRTTVTRLEPRGVGFDFQVELQPAEVVITYRTRAVDAGFAKSFADEFVAFAERRC